MSTGKQSDPVIQQLMAQRLMYGQNQPAIKLDNITTLGGGIASGIANAANNFLQARRDQQMMGAFMAAQQQQQQALADKAAADTKAKEMFYQAHGWSPEQAKIDAAAQLDNSTINNLLSNQQAIQKDQTEQAQKQAHWKSTFDAVKARLGNDPNAIATAQLAANAAAFGVTPLGAEAFGQDIGGTLKTNRLDQLTGGDPDILRTQRALAPLQNAAAAYGMPTLHDAYSDVERQTDLSTKVTNNRYIAPLNDASLASSSANTQGKLIDNQMGGINLGLAQGQLGLNQGYINGDVSLPEFAKGSLGFTLNPLPMINSLTGNKAFYGHGNSLIPKADGLNFIPAQKEQQAPVPAPPQAPMPLFKGTSSHYTDYHNGEIIQQNAGRELNKFGAGIQQGVGNAIDDTTGFAQTLSGFLGLPQWQAPWQQNR